MPNKNPAYLQAVAVDALTGTAASNAITLNADAFIITSESLTTAAGAEYVCTMTNNRIAANSIVITTAGKGTSTQGTPMGGSNTVTNGQVVINVTNLHASEALNGTIKIYGWVINPKGV